MKLAQRHLPRLREFDYSRDGYYFLTLCVRDMKCLLGLIPEEEGADIQLSETGQLVQSVLQEFETTSAGIQVEKSVIMPNHVHMIVVVQRQANQGDPHPSNQMIPKFVSLFKRKCTMKMGSSIWQRSYYDHIIRGERDYQRIWQYIDNNVLRWKLDRYYPA